MTVGLIDKYESLEAIEPMSSSYQRSCKRSQPYGLLDLRLTMDLWPLDLGEQYIVV